MEGPEAPVLANMRLYIEELSICLVAVNTLKKLVGSVCHCVAR